MEKVKIRPWSLFFNGEDVRKYMEVDMHDELIHELSIELNLSYDDIKIILSEASIFLYADRFPKYIKADIYEVD